MSILIAGLGFVVALALCAVLRILFCGKKGTVIKNILVGLFLVGAMANFPLELPVILILPVSAGLTVGLHFIAKARQKKKDKKKQLQTPPLNPYLQQGAYPVPPQPMAYPASPRVPVQPAPVQTLRVCVRCGRPLAGPVCGSCRQDHTAAAVCMLQYVPPEKLMVSRQP